MNDRKYFEIFTEHCDRKFDLYNKIKDFIEEEIVDARGIENAKAYNVLTKLSNSENNAGWEDRHSERIDILNKTQADIIDDYEQYLP